MMWLISVLLLLCMSITTFSQINDDFDCEIPPPVGVEPLTCCQISKPFDQSNFPECFPNAPPTTTTTVPPIPVNEDFDDDDDHDHDHDHDNGHDRDHHDDDDDASPINERINGPTNGPTSKDESYAKWWDLKKDKYHGYGHWPGKSHGWGHDNYRHFHHDDYQNQGDYQRSGYHGGRHRRQVVYRINSAPSAPQSPLCSIECIFNQTNILANGRFDRNVAFNVYADFYPEIPIDLLTRTIDRCTKQLRNYLISRRRRRNQIGRSLPLRRCRNGSGLFAACFNREIYRNCPIDLDSDSEECDTLRTFIDNCSPIRGIRNNFSYDNVDVDENGNFIPNN